MVYKSKKILSLIVFLFLCVFAPFIYISASTSAGTVDPSFKYTWAENVGWVDFSHVEITDTALSGSAYGENIGWIDLSTVTNDSEGALSGHAWAENVGWIDFSHTTIGTDGVFSGFAYGENIGNITFGTGDNKVATDWRPASTRNSNPPTPNPTPTSGSRGGGSSRSVNLSPGPAVHATVDELTKRIEELKKQLALLSNKGNNSNPYLDYSSLSSSDPTSLSSCPDMSLGQLGYCPKWLQIFLNKNGFEVASTGWASKGSEVQRFGFATRDALIKFQKEKNITPSVGYFGSKTKAVIKNMGY